MSGRGYQGRGGPAPVKSSDDDSKRQNNNNRGGRGYRRPPIQHPKFEGKTEALKGFIYDFGDTKNADMYTLTTREIAEYVGRTFTYGSDMANAIYSLTLPVIVEPPEPALIGSATVLSKAQDKIFEKEIIEYCKRKAQLSENINKVYAIVWGQCSEVLREKVRAVPSYDTMSANANGIALLSIIKDIIFKRDINKDPWHAWYNSVVNLFSFKQTPTMNNQHYYEKFQNLLDVVEHNGGGLGVVRDLENEMLKIIPVVDPLAPTVLEILSAKTKSKERFNATMFLMNADIIRYGALHRHIQNERLEGVNKYPDTLTGAYNRLVSWIPDPSYPKYGGMQTNDGVAFANVGKRDKSTIECYNCGKLGHLSYECTEPKVEKEKEKDESAVQMLNAGMDYSDFEDYDASAFTFHQDGNTISYQSVLCEINSNGKVSKDWILLDNQSTVDVFYNKSLLKNIRQSVKGMEIHCNAGTTTTRMIGELPGYGTVWYHPEGIANILSLSRVSKKYRVTFDSSNGNEFIIHKDDGKCHHFRQSEKGLYFMDTIKKGTALVIETVENKKSKYTNRDYSAALSARRLQNILGFPSIRTFVNLIDKKLLPNCPVTRKDIMAAEDIFGPAVAALKGKTTRRKPDPVRVNIADIPHDIIARYRDIVLTADIMYVNNIAFFMTVSRNVKFGTAEMIASKSNAVIVNAIRQVQKTYKLRGFRITHLLVDGEFDSIRAEVAVLGITLNTVARGEHVPEIERYIRTVKERTRCLHHTLPFPICPKRLVVEMVYTSVFWLNAFPPADGISEEYGPRAIITGAELDWQVHCQLEFGAYVQVHEEHDNSLAPRTTGALALRPTGNAQGGYFFYSLTTGRKIARYAWTALPMPAEVIRHVNYVARDEKAHPGIAFLDREYNIFPEDQDEDDPDDGSWHPDDDAGNDDEYDDDDYVDDNDDDRDDVDNNDQHEPIAGVIPDDMPVPDYNDGGNIDQNNNLRNAAHDVPPNFQNYYDALQEDENEDDNEPEDMDENNNQPYDYIVGNAPVELPNLIVNNEEMEPAVVENENDGIENVEVMDNAHLFEVMRNLENEIHEREEREANYREEMDRRYGERIGRYDLRARRPRDYTHRGIQRPRGDDQMHTMLSSAIFTQYSIKKGLKKFGKKGVEAVQSELKQLHDRSVLVPKSAKDITYEQRKAALAYLMFLKEKRCGTVKARGCADGRKQRSYTAKEDASSPTVAIESVLLSSLADAHERRDVGTADVPGAFMHTDMDELVHMRLEGTMAELLVNLEPKLYRKHVIMENGRQVLYVELRKALYGTLRAALLFWRKLSEQLIEWGFIVNPYDWCVANKEIDGSQCTILWHVDDLKVSHKDANVVTDVLNQLNAVFGTEDSPLAIHRGKIHEYLGMTLDFSVDGKVRINMEKYIEKILEEVPSDMEGESPTPAGLHLFTVSESPELLPEEEADLYHHYVAKLLFMCKRARPDIQTAVAFLTTRVKSPDRDDYKKLTRVIRYLRATKDLCLTLEANNMNVMKWWVDGSYAVHPDMKSHTGGMLSLGGGAIYGTSTRQKLNTKSSTEAELVAVNDVLPQVLWTRYFLKAQGYDTEESIVYQDNQSAILLEKNGRGSSSKRTRHINIRYFFVQDRIQNKEVQIQYCPTGDMIADFFTKPLQGTQFRKFRDLIMNDQSNSSYYTSNGTESKPNLDHRSVLESEIGFGAKTGIKNNPTNTGVNNKKRIESSKAVSVQTDAAATAKTHN